MVISLLFNQMYSECCFEIVAALQIVGRALELQSVNKIPAAMLRYSRHLMSIIALSSIAIGSFASERTPVMQAASCKEMPKFPFHPSAHWKLGISRLGFLIRPDGTVAQSVVLNSSASAALDQAAQKGISTCLFKRPADSEQAGDLWAHFVYVWSADEDPGFMETKGIAARAASKGNLAERYHLSLLLDHTARTDVERQQALVTLRSAAELGHAHAQFDLGERYEDGKGVAPSLEEALRWYRKSAAQGDPLALQRMKQLESSHP